MNDHLLPPSAILRMIDANANRAREALRVMEDYARFALNDPAITADLKNLRHTLAQVLSTPPLNEAIYSRDTQEDVGTSIKTPAELTRDSLASVIIAAGKRLSESLRVLEECLKTIDPTLAQTLEQSRYQGYIIEQQLARTLPTDARNRFEKVQLYILLTDALCHPTLGGWENTLDQILAANTAEPNRLCIQLREKSLSDSELLRRAKILADKCRRAAALSIINDRPDIALLANADGIHLGQNDLPCTDARKTLGPKKIIGISTENLAQAHQALRDGATYLALGPMFPTTTKEKPRLAGPAYAAQALRELPSEIPLVAIGGINAQNLQQLTTLGIRRACVCSAIIAQANPSEQTAAFLHMLEKSAISSR